MRCRSTTPVSDGGHGSVRAPSTRSPTPGPRARRTSPSSAPRPSAACSTQPSALPRACGSSRAASTGSPSRRSGRPRALRSPTRTSRRSARADTLRSRSTPAGCGATLIAAEHDEPASCSPISASSLGEGEQRVSSTFVAARGGTAGDAGDARGPRRRPRDARRREDAAPARRRLHRPPEPVPLPAGLTATLRPYQRHGLDFLAHAARLGLGASSPTTWGSARPCRRSPGSLHLRERGSRTAARRWSSARLGGAQLGARGGALRARPARARCSTSGEERHALREEIPRARPGRHQLRAAAPRHRRLARRAAARRDPRRGAEHQEPRRRGRPAPRSHLDARHRLALTGTPLENRAARPVEHHAASCNPGYLGRRAAFVDALRPPRRAAARPRACSPPSCGRCCCGASSARSRTICPTRIEERRDCELTTGSASSTSPSWRGAATLRRAPERPARRPARKNASHVLAALTRLRQICCHPALAGGRTASARASSTRSSSCSSRCSPRATRCWCSRSSWSA